MGICLAYYTATDATIDRLVADPELVAPFLDPDEDPPSELELVDGERYEMDLDKAWHGIHFLLAESAEPVDGPLGLLNHGGTHFENVDVGYGPPYFLRAADLARAHAELQAVDDATLRARFAPAAMNDVYPDIWEDGDDALDYLMDHVGALRKGLADAVKNGMGWIVAYV